MSSSRRVRICHHHSGMKRSERRILTTHVGSLPRPRELLAPLHARESGEPYDAAALQRAVAETTAQVARRQADLGIDVLNDGEHGRASFATYANTRIGGLEREPHPPPRSEERRVGKE